MYKDTNFITESNYSNYFIQTNEGTYKRAENADDHKIYYEVTPASKATKDTY